MINFTDEEQVYRFWENQGLFKADPTTSKPPYSLLMPPPNVNGALHLGHAMQHAILDGLARFKRMQGYDVLLLPGVDHAGILFEGTLNKQLEKEGTSKQKLGREKWMERARQFKEENYEAFHDTWKVFGLSADWDREVFTLDPKVQQAVLTEFTSFWEQDLLYKGAYIVQWCPKCGTAIEDVEMEYQERQEKLYYIRYQIEGTSEFITVATARPETIFADTGIATYPNHPQFKQFVGKLAINPLTHEQLPIFEDKRVDKGFGTGALKITPGHDPLDYEIGRDHSLPILHAIDKTGRMTDRSVISDNESLVGFKINQARERAAEILEERGAIEKAEVYTHNVPVCERCKTTVEPLISEEWFVKMKQLADKAIAHIGEINFLPKNFQGVLTKWLENIHDWSISRSLWWGHRIPVWYCESSNPGHEVGKDKDMVISFTKPAKKCSCGDTEWVQDEQVLDTWFSSGMWPLATLGWPSKTAELERYFPWSFEITAPEIRYLWIARMIMLSLHFTGTIPFKNMFFHGMLRDLQGRKFSKSLGNGIDPNILRSQWGTDAVRMALYTYSAPGRDGRASRQTMGERCKNFRNFGTKLRNIARFTIELAPETVRQGRKNAEDEQVLKKVNLLAKTVAMDMEKFNLHLATERIYEFIWHDLADKYLESVKHRREEAQGTLLEALKKSLIILHPFMPFLTEELYQKLPIHQLSIMQEAWPV